MGMVGCDARARWLEALGSSGTAAFSIGFALIILCGMGLQLITNSYPFSSFHIISFLQTFADMKCYTMFNDKSGNLMAHL